MTTMPVRAVVIAVIVAVVPVVAVPVSIPAAVTDSDRHAWPAEVDALRQGRRRRSNNERADEAERGQSFRQGSHLILLCLSGGCDLRLFSLTGVRWCGPWSSDASRSGHT